MTITIGGVDRTSLIQFGSLQKTDALNSQADTLNFSILYYAGQTWRPEVNAEVIMTVDSVKEFGGKIISISKEIRSDGVVKYSIRCKDYSYDADRLLVNEEYKNKTVAEIITDFVATYASDFTTAGVSCDINIVKIVFNRESVSACLKRLASLTNYSWYIDYEKDIHFYSKNTEPAPFNITDDDENCIADSLEASEDFSQIRNRVFIKGGEVEGDPRTETFDGDGSKKQFVLANKFASVPAVTVGGVSKTVGIDYLDNEDDFDCFWSFSSVPQYVRFKTATTPGAGTNNISVTGNPLYSLVVQVSEPASIAQYGVFEVAKTDKTIKSRETAVQLARSEIEAYKDGLIEGSFDTYTPGLRSGQIINVNSVVLNINEDFLIQRVTFKMINDTTGYYQVTLATLRTVTIIDFLIGLLTAGDRLIEDTGETAVEKTEFPLEHLTIEDSVTVNDNNIPEDETLEIDDTPYVQAIDFNTIFVAGPYIPDPTDPSDNKRVFICNGSRLS
jgi:hypothetical protein